MKENVSGVFFLNTVYNITLFYNGHLYLIRHCKMQITNSSFI